MDYDDTSFYFLIRKLKQYIHDDSPNAQVRKEALTLLKKITQEDLPDLWYDEEEVGFLCHGSREMLYQDTLEKVKALSRRSTSSLRVLNKQVGEFTDNAIKYKTRYKYLRSRSPHAEIRKSANLALQSLEDELIDIQCDEADFGFPEIERREKLINYHKEYSKHLLSLSYLRPIKI